MGKDIPTISEQLVSLTSGLKGFGTFADKPETVIVPTIFPGLNRATRVGGVASGSTLLLHGPSKGGKTALALGLVLSYQKEGHLAVYIDAEHTLDKPWAKQCGVDLDNLIYHQPSNYEQTVLAVDTILENFRKARKNGSIPPTTYLLFIVDSITKLVPENELEKLAKQDKNYPIRAMMNTAWLDRLTVTIGDLPVLFTMLAHEKRNLNAKPWDEEYHVKGGDALVYDSTMQIRVKVKSNIKEGSKPNIIQVGKLHHCVLKKNKVGIDGEQFYFVMSNGKGDCPIGFDKAKELLEECKLRKNDSPMIRGSMGLWTWEGFEGGELRGDKKVERLFNENSELLSKLTKELDSTGLQVRVQEVGDLDAENEENEDE